jgi:hypothetical protein
VILGHIYLFSHATRDSAVTARGKKRAQKTVTQTKAIVENTGVKKNLVDQALFATDKYICLD